MKDLVSYIHVTVSDNVIRSVTHEDYSGTAQAEFHDSYMYYVP